MEGGGGGAVGHWDRSGEGSGIRGGSSEFRGRPIARLNRIGNLRASVEEFLEFARRGSANGTPLEIFRRAARATYDPPHTSFRGEGAPNFSIFGPSWNRFFCSKPGRAHMDHFIVIYTNKYITKYRRRNSSRRGGRRSRGGPGGGGGPPGAPSCYAGSWAASIAACRRQHSSSPAAMLPAAGLSAVDENCLNQ